MSTDLLALMRAERFDAIRELLDRALTTLSTTRGRASVDDRAIGAVRFLLERTQESVDVCRTAILGQFPKRCRCGRAHDESAWKALPLVGEMGDEVERVELRDCPCGSTITIEIETEAA